MHGNKGISLLKKQSAKQYNPKLQLEQEYSPYETAKCSPMQMNTPCQSVKEENIVNDYSSDSCSEFDMNEKMDVISVKPTMQLDTVSMASSIFSYKVIKVNNESKRH